MQRHIFLPWALGRGKKGEMSLNLNYKVNFKHFKPNFVCLLANERYKAYQTEFSFGRLGHVPGVGLEGTSGVGCHFFHNFKQIWYVSYLHECHMQQYNLLPPPPLWGLWEGPKGQISLNLKYNVNFKDF